MSIAAMAWAKRQTAGSSGRKLVLLVLADYGTYREDLEPEGSDGRHFAWANQRTIARDAEMTDRSVRTHLEALEAAGLIRRYARGGEGEGRRADIIVLAVDDDGPRPFTDHPVDTSVDDNVDNATGRNCREGATGKSEQGNRKNGAGRPYIEPPEEQAEGTKRGTRLPEPFEVTDEMAAWYRENIGGAVNGRMEHEKFVDYWRSRTGQIAVKKNWPATWRNWMRSALERSGRRPNGAQRPTPRFQTAQERSAARLAEERDLLVRAEEIVEQEGGDPENSAQVNLVYERLKAQRAEGSASRTSDMYIEGEIVTPREVTAGEGQ